jgi:hypothetical protein
MTVRIRVAIITAVVLVVATVVTVVTLSTGKHDGPATAVSGVPVVPHAPGTSAAPVAGTRVCGQPVLDSPWNYDGPAGTFTTSGKPAALPTFGTAGTDFPHAKEVVVIPAGNNTVPAATERYLVPNVVFYFEPGMHYLEAGMYTSPYSAYVGGYTNRLGKAIINGVDGGTNGTGRGGAYLNVAVGGEILHDQTWEYLTIENYSSAEDSNAVMGEAANNDVYKYLTIGPNEYGGLGDTGVPPKKGEASDGGYALDLASNDTVEHDCITHNAQGGFNGQGININISDDEISWNGLGIYPDCAGGSGCNPDSDGNSGGGKLFYSLNATLVHNFVHDNYGPGIWMDTDDAGTDISENYISSNYSTAIIYEASYNANISDNTLTGNGWPSDGEWPAGIGGKPCTSNGVSCSSGGGALIGFGGGFPYSDIYIPNSGGNSNLNVVHIPDSIPVPGCASNCILRTRYSGHIWVVGNVLENDFGGIMAYTDDNRYPGSLNNDSSCWMPLGPLGIPNSTTYGYQSKVLVTGADAVISGNAVTVASGTTTICNNYGHNNGTDSTGQPDQQASPPNTVRAPSVGMAVFDQDTGAFLGNVASVANSRAFTLTKSAGNLRGATLVLSGYGGCGPADYYRGELNVRSGNPPAYYWNNCIFGAENITVSKNELYINASTVTGCTTANLCGFTAAFAFTPGVSKSQQYWEPDEKLIANSSGGLGNVFSDNTYLWSGGGEGSWQFAAGSQGNYVSYAQWRASPYNQDAGSTSTG